LPQAGDEIQGQKMLPCSVLPTTTPNKLLVIGSYRKLYFSTLAISVLDSSSKLANKTGCYKTNSNIKKTLKIPHV